MNEKASYDISFKQITFPLYYIACAVDFSPHEVFPSRKKRNNHKKKKKNSFSPFEKFSRVDQEGMKNSGINRDLHDKN
jgi:hypothetical protein